MSSSTPPSSLGFLLPRPPAIKPIQRQKTENNLYVYVWKANPFRTLDRKGQRCQVLVRAKKNSALVEFPDGYKAVISRYALRKWKETEITPDPP